MIKTLFAIWNLSMSATRPFEHEQNVSYWPTCPAVLRVLRHPRRRTLQIRRRAIGGCSIAFYNATAKAGLELRLDSSVVQFKEAGRLNG
jgi:hypothetical protein